MKTPTPLALVAAVGFVLVLVGGTVVATGMGPNMLSTDSGTALQFDRVDEQVGFEYASNRENQFGNTRASVYVSDYDRNGYPDLLALGGERPVLFENTGGAFEPSGELPAVNGTVKGALFFDADGDGWDDLLLLRMLDSPVFLANDGGDYERRDAGLGDVNLSVPVSASAADYDADGCLDVFVAQNGAWAYDIPKKEIVARKSGRTGLITDIAVEDDNGNRNVLLEGDCENGTFSRVADAGFEAERWTTTASFVDLTGDGRPDVHAGNDFNFDYLYVNQGDGTFAARKIPGTNRHAMSSEIVDINGDGRMDVFETNVHYERESWTMKARPTMDNSGNVVLVNTNGSFRPAGYNVTDGSWGWAAAVTDLDNDGDRDIVHATKYYRNGSKRSDIIPTYPKLWAREDGTFRPRNASALGFNRTDGRGLAVLDFDRDGDLDVAIANIAGRYALYENTGADADWLQVAVRGDGDTLAVGARLTVTANDRERHVVVNSRADLQSQDTRVSHVGLGSASTATVEVTWPDGTTRRFADIETNQRVAVYPNGTVRTVDRDPETEEGRDD